MPWPRIVLPLAALVLLAAPLRANLPTRPIDFAELPDDFAETIVVRNLSGATGMAVAPDGRVFLCEQTGALRVVKDGKLLPEPFVRLAVDSTWERGLIGVALDPAFPRKPHVYLCHVAARPYPHHRVSRFTARGNVAVPGSEVVLLKGDDQRKLGGAVPAGHQGGPIAFGPDGKLYVAIGEQTAGDPAQRLDTFQGKLLRINADGTIPADNPFPGKTRGKYRAIWALGLRNPFGLAFQGRTGRLYINDVGGSLWEEINEGKAGANYGWPLAEGAAGRASLVDPVHAYDRSVGRCITGGTFYDPPRRQFPDRYRGRYFFCDYMDGWVRVLDPARPGQSELFARGLRGPVDLRVAPDGSLYVLERNAWVKDDQFRTATGVLRRIVYATGASGDFPRLTAHPTGAIVAPGQKVVLRVQARGTGPLSYRWERDGKPIAGTDDTLSFTAQPSTACYRCLVRGPHGAARSRPAVVRVEPLRPANVAAPVLPGLECQWCALASMAELARLDRADVRTVRRVEPPVVPNSAGLAVRLRGLVQVPEDGVWTFTLQASGPSWLYVAGTRLAGTEGATGASRSVGHAGLRKGLHDLLVVFTHSQGKPVLRLSWCGPGREAGEVPATALCRADPATAVPVIRPDGGTFSGPVRVALSAPGGARARYTLDGSAPSAQSGLYHGPFRLEKSAVVRAVLAAREAKAEFRITGTAPYGLPQRQTPWALNVPRSPDHLPARLSMTGVFRSLATLTPGPGLIPYEVNSPLWSDGAAKRRWIAVPAGAQIRFRARGEWGFPVGTVFVKHFELPGRRGKPQRLETRLLVSAVAGTGYGATYRWRPDGSEADLLPDGLTETVDARTGRTWTYPSRSDCLVCHNATAGFVLGVNTRQLNRSTCYPGPVTDNQLRAWRHAGLFEPAPVEKDIASYARLSAAGDTKASLEARVRSYLDANCAFCHRPGGSPGQFDARFDMPLARQKLLTAPLVAADLGLRGVGLVTPGDPARSMLSIRMTRRRDVFNMPPLASSVPDKEALATLAAWIESLPARQKK
jgi:uncharacterized repeat protein (TIGR03806 family)